MRKSKRRSKSKTEPESPAALCLRLAKSTGADLNETDRKILRLAARALSKPNFGGASREGILMAAGFCYGLSMSSRRDRLLLTARDRRTLLAAARALARAIEAQGLAAAIAREERPCPSPTNN